MIGGRQGQPNVFRRLLARATACNLNVFVVPGVEVAHASGLDLKAAGLQPVPTPRQANVLLLVSPIPDPLARAAVGVYAQMPRPRAIAAVEASPIAHLPNPDVVVDCDQVSLVKGIKRLREVIASGAWQPGIQSFMSEALDEIKEFDVEAMAHHHHHGHEGDHDHHMHHHRQPSETTAEHAHHEYDEHGQHQDHHGHHGHEHHGRHHEHHEQEHHGHHAHHDHDQHAYDHDEPHEHEHHDHQEHHRHSEHGGTNVHEAPESEHDRDHEMMGHHDHGMTMDHSGHGYGFMSMVAMTKDLPRSPDGLPMEWVEAPFGPLHPGLPAGLNLTLTLDGDRIARAEVVAGAVTRHLETNISGPAEAIPERFAQLDRLAPGVYQILAEQALEATNGVNLHGTSELERLVALERARVISHLGWLAAFGYLLGYGWLTDEAARVQLEFMHGGEVDSVRARAARMCRRIDRSLLVRWRLQGLARIDPETHPPLRGPVARAAGLAVDARLNNPAYRALGFRPQIHSAGDALARLQVRLDEILQSLDLVQAASGMTGYPGQAAEQQSQDGNVMIETPRGAATMHLMFHHDYPVHAHLDTPSATHLQLVSMVAEGEELAAGLLGIASLDLSPWEVDR